jgi:hypothetical protein
MRVISTLAQLGQRRFALFIRSLLGFQDHNASEDIWNGSLDATMQPNERDSIALTGTASSVVTNFEPHGKEKMRG